MSTSMVKSGPPQDFTLFMNTYVQGLQEEGCMAQGACSIILMNQCPVSSKHFPVNFSVFVVFKEA